MPPTADNPALTFGQRVKRARERAGLTRPVLGGLVGRSAEWVKWIETGRSQLPRLPVLLRLADVLGIQDLAELTGEERLSAATYAKAAHDALPAVKEALTTYRFAPRDEEPETAGELNARVRQAWQLWHGIGSHRTRVAALLPDLLADCQHAARSLHDQADRRRVLVALAQTYHLAQLYLAYQPTPELVMLTGDRAMTAAQDADSPQAIAASAWYMSHVFRDSGERHEARIDLAMKAVDLLDRRRSPDDMALWGLLHLAAALSYAKVGRRGDAWRHWDRSAQAARQLGAYTHPWLIFGRAMVDAYAITLSLDLVQTGSAIEAATRVDLTQMPSATRRAFHLVEAARAHSMQGNDIAVVHLLTKAHEASPETVKFNLFTRSTLPGLATDGSTMIREDARHLAHRIGVPA